MRVTTEPGVEIDVVEAGSGPAVVLLHGWALGKDVWEPELARLAAAGHRTVALDLRGHNRSSPDPPSGYALDRLAGDVIGVLDALEIATATLVGWSLGGLVAFRVAAQRPDRVSRLVLVASNGVAHARQPGFPFGVEPGAVLPALLAGERRNPERTRRGVIGEGFAGEPDGDLDRLVALSMRTPTATAVGCLHTLLETDQAGLAPGLRVPLVQINGAQDPSVSRSGARWLIDAVPGARHVSLPCGHYPMFETPGAFGEALRAAVA